MRLSFEDQESLKEAVGSIYFNNLPSDRNIRQMRGNTTCSNSTMPYRNTVEG